MAPLQTCTYSFSRSLTDEVPLLDVVVGDAESLVEVEEDGVGGDVAEAEVAVRGARRVAPLERGQNALLHQERKHLRWIEIRLMGISRMMKNLATRLRD